MMEYNFNGGINVRMQGSFVLICYFVNPLAVMVLSMFGIAVGLHTVQVYVVHT